MSPPLSRANGIQSFVGTLAYAAPEIGSSGQTGYTHLVDSWSVGLTIFAMLTGKNGVNNCEALECFQDTMPILDLSPLEEPSLKLSNEGALLFSIFFLRHWADNPFVVSQTLHPCTFAVRPKETDESG
jgi:serine/threonine protein kinase